jgi:hypothetical protein
MQRGSGDRRRDGDGGAHDATMKNAPAKVKTGTKIAIRRTRRYGKTDPSGVGLFRS